MRRFFKGELTAVALKGAARVLRQLRELLESQAHTKVQHYPLPTMCFLFDTGADAHLTNVESAFKPGSVRKCDVSVSGISGGSGALRAALCGVVEYRMNDSVYELNDVLYVPGAALGETASADTPTVLVGGKKFVRESNVGLLFAAGGKEVYFVSPNFELVGKFPSQSTNLYTHVVHHPPAHARTQTNSKNFPSALKILKNFHSERSSAEIKKEKIFPLYEEQEMAQQEREHEREHVSERTSTQQREPS